MFEYDKIIITDVHLFVSQYYKIYIKPNPINLRGGFLDKNSLFIIGAWLRTLILSMCNILAQSYNFGVLVHVLASYGATQKWWCAL